MEEQIRQQLYIAFWDKIDDDILRKDYIHIKILLQEIYNVMCNFVPSRKDIHNDMANDFNTIDENTPKKLVEWIKIFQAPIYDVKVDDMLKNEKLSEFLKQFYDHLFKIQKEITEYKQNMTKTGTIPLHMKTGF